MPTCVAQISESSKLRRSMRALLATPLLLFALAASVHADPLFSAPFLSFDAGSNPYSVAIPDLNGDGRPDLAVANSSLKGSEICELLNFEIEKRPSVVV